MNRVIKFRGLKDDMSNCNWVYGSLVYDASGQPRIANVDTSGEGLIFHTCISGTEGQLLYSNNGKEWYDGDIVKISISSSEIGQPHEDYYYPGFEGYATGVLSCIPSKGVVIKNYTMHDTDNDVSRIVKGYKQISFYRSEIVGNIHENPELL